MSKRSMALVVGIAVVALVLLACTGGGNGGSDWSSSPVARPAGQEPAGMDRFSKEAVEEYGCPDADKVPTWLEIPECE